MRTGRPKKALEMCDDDREKLTTIARRPKSSQALAMRARIVLDCARGLSNSEVAQKLHIAGATVGKWRERFRQSGIDGLLDEPRVGAPRKISDQKIEEVVTKTLETMPVNSTHWSTRLMAAETGLTQNAIVRIWRAFGLQPHRVENFKFSKDCGYRKFKISRNGDAPRGYRDGNRYRKDHLGLGKCSRTGAVLESRRT